jgi:hypothetical protein
VKARQRKGIAQMKAEQHKHIQMKAGQCKRIAQMEAGQHKRQIDSCVLFGFRLGIDVYVVQLSFGLDICAVQLSFGLDVCVVQITFAIYVCVVQFSFGLLVCVVRTLIWIYDIHEVVLIYQIQFQIIKHFYETT